MTDLSQMEAIEPASSEAERPEPTALFVGGVPRGGSSVVARILNNDERIVLASGRFARARDRVDPFHLQPQVFFAPTRHETGGVARHALYEELRAKFDSGAVRHIGDVQDGYAVRLSLLTRRFPEGRFIVVYRPLSAVLTGDEATRAKTEMSWRATMQNARAAAGSRHGSRVFLVSTNRLAREDVHLEALWRFLGMDLTEPVRERVDGMRARMAAQAPPVATPDDQLERWAEARIAEQERRGE